MIDYTTPRDLGLPFDRFNAIGRLTINNTRILATATQLDVAKAIVSSPRRFVVVRAPTGAGKTVIWAAACRMLGRGVVTVGTKALQDQYSGSLDAVSDVRGRANYRCAEFGSCAEGVPEGCSRFPHAGCPYADAIQRAKRGKLAVVNFSMLLSNPEVSDNADVLVVDEAHGMHDALCDNLRVDIPRNKLTFGFRGKLDSVEGISSARDHLRSVYASTPKSSLVIRRTIAQWGRQLTTLKQRIALAPAGTWLYTPSNSAHIWRCVWGRSYAEERLFRGIPKVVLMSATVYPGTATELGIGEFDFIETGSTIEISRRRVYMSPGPKTLQVRMGQATTDSELKILVNRIDRIVAYRANRKIFIPSVSFRLAERIRAISAFKQFMLVGPDSLPEFMQRRGFAILVSPSVREGISFDDDLCRCIIVPKLPFPDSRDPVSAARLAANKQYAITRTATALEQSIGRGTRHRDDWCATFIVDSHIVWFLPNLSAYVRSAVVRDDGLELKLHEKGDDNEDDS